jgi:hypothetical protein
MDFIRLVAIVRNALGVMAREERPVPHVRIIVARRIGRTFMALPSPGATTEMVVVFGAKPETAAPALVYLVERP